MRSQIYLSQGQIQAAINDLLQVEKKRPAMASFLLAVAYASLQDSTHTFFYLEKNLNSSFKVPKNTIWQEKAFKFLYNTPKWKKLWEKEWYSHYEYYEGEMRYLFEAENWTGIINMMADAGHDSRRLSAHAYYMTGIAYMQLENYAAALTNFNIALSKAKKEAQYYAARGRCYLHMKNYSKALNDFATAIQWSPELPANYLQYALALMGLKKNESAFEVTLTLSQLFPNNREILYTHARVSYLTKRYLQALTSVNQLLNQVPEDSAYLHLRAMCYSQTSMFPQALKDYERLLHKYPNQPIFLLERGNIYFQIKDKQRACNDWKQSAQMGNLPASQLLWENCSQ
ncbi:MAG: tetratricopeptide repeat protein [Bacteroidales bacterium]